MNHKTTPTAVTLSGVEINLIDPDVMIIPIEDILHPLSRMGRFGNHTLSFRSVAEHSLDAAFLAKHLSKERRLPDAAKNEKIAFCHEFAESIFGDMPSPLKYEPSLAGYKFLEKQMMKLFYMRFCGIARQPEIVSEVDLMLLYWEARHLNLHIYGKILRDNEYNTRFITESVDYCDRVLGKPKCLPFEEIYPQITDKYNELFLC